MAKKKENYQRSIAALLDFLKDRGHDRGKIEDRLGYSTNGIDQSLSRTGGSLKLLKTIELYRDYVLNNSTSNSGVLVPAPDADLTQLVTALRELQIAADKIQGRIDVLLASGKGNSDSGTHLNPKHKGN